MLLIWPRKELLARMVVIPQMARKLVILLGEGSNRGSPLCIQRLLRLLLLRLPPAVKVKRKLAFRGGVSDIPIFDADVPETPLDPASDLTPRAGRGKRPAEGTPDHAARLSKRASRVVQYVVSSNEEGANEPVLAETPSAQTAAHEGPAEGANAAVPSPEEVNELHVPTSTPPRTASPSRVASPPVAMGEPNVSSGQPQPSGRSESADRPGPSKQPGASASGSGVAHETLPVGSTKADEGTVSLSDFSATEICSHLINNDVYIGEGWEHVKGKPCNKKMEFFFNCHSLMMSELAENYKYGNKVSREIKRLREQASILAAEKLSVEESYAQQLAQLRESAQITAEEKLFATEEEVRSLKEQLSTSQESLAARLEAERLAEEAKEKLNAVLEAEAVDRFKRSPAYYALLLREFERSMRQSKKFFAMKDHSNEKALRRFDRIEPNPMHLEIPSKRAFNTYYSGQKGSFSGSGAEPDLGPVSYRDYGPFMPDGDEEITWPSEDEIEDEEDSEGPPAAS
ncbi:hypothetical protein LWI29_017917 [Acer saccharum]|uniref:Uncharacterized protein n=1 Tax=Acer saccharum TaxID=4024 RepID=A0AA39SIT2_ACESA|nr:hypothetical protein LWI29_017917 [Acer saccharum]